MLCSENVLSGSLAKYCKESIFALPFAPLQLKCLAVILLSATVAVDCCLDCIETLTGMGSRESGENGS